MNVQWLNQGAACPIVEMHEIRAEKFRAERYLALHEDALSGPLATLGAVDLGHFFVRGHPDRLIHLRGFASMLARRRALTAFHASEGWAGHRQEAADLVRDSRVTLTRALAPAEGLRPLRAGAPLLALVSELRFAEQLGNYHLWLRLLLRKAGLDPIAALATLEAVNDVPTVPVMHNRSQHIALLRADGRVPELPPELRGMLRFAPEALTLEPAGALVW